MRRRNRPGDQDDQAAAIGAVDALLASVGLEHGRRATLTGSWKNGERVRPALPPAAPSAGDGSPAGTPGLELVPGWGRYSWLRAGFSTRMGGQSAAYSEADEGVDQNLGFTAEDDPATVMNARQRFTEQIAGNSAAVELVSTRQFHSNLISVIEPDHGALRLDERRSALRGDGLIAQQAELLLGILTADCVPVLVADTKTRVVAAFHAGWRGTLGRIVERGVGTLRLHYNSRPEDLIAAIGPAIGACCFAVGEEVRFDFESQFAYAAALFSEVYDSDPVRKKYPLLFLTARAPGHSNIGPQIHLDLQKANQRQLLDAGVREDAIQILAECTACTRMPDGRRKYFSHRGEHGFTGRMLSVIGTSL